MDNRQNLESYSDVENLERFDETSFAEYCGMKLRTAEPNVNFIRKHILPGQSLDNLNICEIGSGNSKLLYALEKQMSNGGGVNSLVMRLVSHVGNLQKNLRDGLAVSV